MPGPDTPDLRLAFPAPELPSDELPESASEEAIAERAARLQSATTPPVVTVEPVEGPLPEPTPEPAVPVVDSLEALRARDTPPEPPADLEPPEPHRVAQNRTLDAYLTGISDSVAEHEQQLALDRRSVVVLALALMVFGFVLMRLVRDHVELRAVVDDLGVGE